MKTIGWFVASALLLVVVTPALAQQPATVDQHHQAPATATKAAPTPSPAAGGAPMMEKCAEKMAGMGMPAMGATPTDPKEKAAMLRMRGEMMKAMGDVMIKHGQQMQGTADKK